MKLNLKNAIIFFDLETTGLDITKDRIVELCYIRVEPNGNEESKSMRINPERHIPEEASKVHGIYDEDVKDCPTFKQVAKTLCRPSRDATWQASTAISSTSPCWWRNSCVQA